MKIIKQSMSQIYLKNELGMDPSISMRSLFALSNNVYQRCRIYYILHRLNRMPLANDDIHPNLNLNLRNSINSKQDMERGVGDIHRTRTLVYVDFYCKMKNRRTDTIYSEKKDGSIHSAAPNVST